MNAFVLGLVVAIIGSVGVVWFVSIIDGAPDKHDEDRGDA